MASSDSIQQLSEHLVGNRQRAIGENISFGEKQAHLMVFSMIGIPARWDSESIT